MKSISFTNGFLFGYEFIFEKTKNYKIVINKIFKN